MEAFDCQGTWWAPDEPSRAVPGTLRFSEERGAELSLTGTLGDTVGSVGGKQLPIILGLADGCPLGDEVTLRGCLLKNLRLTSRGGGREEYFADRLFVGAHLREDEFLFEAVHVSFTGLPSWAAVLGGLSHEHSAGGEDPRRAVFRAAWAPPTPLVARVPGGTLTLGAGVKVVTSRRRYVIKEDVAISIGCERPQAEEHLSRVYVRPLKNLMTLATDRPNAVTTCRMRRPGGRDDIHVLGPSAFPDAEAASDLLPHKMIFTLEDVHGGAGELFGKWVETHDRFAAACELYFNAQDRPDTYVDMNYLIVSQALEAYYREHAGRAGAEFAEAVTALAEEHSGKLAPLFGSHGEVIADLLEYRHFVTHRDTDLNRGTKYAPHLYWLTQRLMFLMRACWLTELGIPAAEQEKLFRRNQLFVHIVGSREQ